jgi:hypothetical protein
MAFNSYTYHANRDARRAAEYLDKAREEKRNGETYPGRVAALVTLARCANRSSRSWRTLRDIQREAR